MSSLRRVTLALLLCACTVRGRSLLADGDLLANNEVDADLGTARTSSSFSSLSPSSPSSWTGIARCALAASPLDCVEQRSQGAVDAMLAQMSEARAAADESALEPEVVDKVSELSEVMVEAAASLLERKLGLHEEEKDGQGLVEEGRGKKKKKIHKLIALVKLVLLVLVVKLKLAFLMMALQTLFQFKIMVMVFLILLTKKISLWAQLKAAKAHEAQKVIYYEHAQHQHHYDDHGGWTSGHDEHADQGHSSGGGGWGGLWGRSYETANGGNSQAQQGASSTGSSVGVQSGVYRAADGTRIVVRPSDPHDMAYSAQRP